MSWNGMTIERLYKTEIAKHVNERLIRISCKNQAKQYNLYIDVLRHP